VQQCPGHVEADFTATVISMADDLLKSIHDSDIARRDKILETFDKNFAAIPVLPVAGDLTREGFVIRHVMQYCGIKLIKKEVLDHWLQGHGGQVPPPNALKRIYERLKAKILSMF
jgi:hypothetical protein